jgi:hypothetical protein
LADTISLFPNECILASTSLNKTAQLWNLETSQHIETPLYEEDVINATFSADGKFLATSCTDGHSTRDVSAIITKAGLLSDIADVTPRPVPKMKDSRQIPAGFFDGALRDANLHTRLSQFNRPSNCPTPLPHQRANSRFFSFLYHFKSHMVTELSAKPQFHPSSWTRNTVAGIMHKLDRSVVEMREPPVFFNCTAGKPRNYHARKKPAAITTVNTHTAIKVTGWLGRFMAWLFCIPIQNTSGQP